MAIVKYSYEKSKELGEELDSLAKMVGNSLIEFGETPLQTFVETFTNTVQGQEFTDAVKALSPHSQVLDIGVGFGQSSMYLSGLGHQVTTIEPSADFCGFLEYFSVKFGLNIEIHQCPVEAFASNEKFDACIFNASFHHCSDPKSVLKKCRDLLCENGKIFLINENMIKFYRSKKWFYKTLKTNPEKLDHYGGNEHAYRHSEYVRMVKQAGFSNCIEKIPVFYQDIRTVFVLNCRKMENNTFKYNETTLVARFLFYYLVKQLIKIPFFRTIAKRLSLVLCTFIGTK
jgi:2-polyprenyl-3-methyl-5-hydroxy-6-metoxy-1,4-benzoquinol methylase